MKKNISLSMLSIIFLASHTMMCNDLSTEVMHCMQEKSATTGQECASHIEELVQTIPEHDLEKPVERVARSRSGDVVRKLALVALSSYLYVTTKIHGALSYLYSLIPTF